MNRKASNWWTIGMLAGLLLFSTALPATFVSENQSEFTAAGDFDGNGQPDVVVVDRATGNYRIAYQTTPGNYLWVDPRAGGIENLGGVAVGRLLNDARDGLAFAAADANRINFVEAESTVSAGVPRAMFVPSVGPAHLAALDVGGSGNTAFDDLFVGSVLNGVAPFRYDLSRNANGFSLSTLNAGPLTSEPARANPIRLKTTAPLIVGLLLRTPGGDTFKAYDVSSGALTEAASASIGLPSQADYVFGNFNTGSSLAQFLFYHPGSNGLYLRLVQEPTPGVFTFSAGSTFNLGSPIRQVFTLQTGGATRLLVVFGEGESARIYDFDGTNFPVPGQSFTPPAGDLLTTAAVMPSGNFLLLSGPPGGVSGSFRSFSFDGSTYVQGQSGSLPALSSLSHMANVLNFNADPFATFGAQLLDSWNAGAWSSQYQLASGQVSVVEETFGGAASGLGSPMPVGLGAPSIGTTYGLVNQYADSVSLFNLFRPLGAQVQDVSVSPAPGRYKTSVQIQFSSSMANSAIYYRTSAAANWQLYTAPFWIFSDTVVSFYAQPSGGFAPVKSVVHHAEYTFSESPGALDSDGDGVPDYVEIAKGLDPVKSGNDADGDGFYDLDELVNGNDPNDPNNHPPVNHPRLELNSAVDIVQTLRPWDGTANAPSVSASGTIVRAFDLNGSVLATGDITNDPPVTGVSTPAVVLSNVVVDTGMRLLSVASEPHFDIVTPSTDKRIGRELIRLFDTASFSHPVTLSNTWSGGDLQSEAGKWITAASNKLASVVRQRTTGGTGVDDTLAALLVERKIQEELLNRGLTQYSNITLFPFRPNDADRVNPPAAELLSLETEPTNGVPAYSLGQALQSVEGFLALPSGSGFDDLKQLAREIYRLSSASNNVPANAVNWPFFPSPVNALRDFIGSAPLHSNYLAYIAMTAGSIAQAHTEARAILDGIGPRPVTNVVLVIRADTFSSACTLLDSLDLAKTCSLIRENGSPYKIVDAFNLLPDSKVVATGYADVPNYGCGDSALQVIAITLDSVPSVTPEDSDGDLLPDALELALFGDLSQSGFGDFDGDGFSNLQEIFDGTDPSNAASKGVSVVNFNLPAVQLQFTPAGQVKLQFQWPAAYANKVQFGVIGSPDLGTPFTQLPAVQTYLGNDTFELDPPDPGGGAFFYQIFMTLK